VSNISVAKYRPTILIVSLKTLSQQNAKEIDWDTPVSRPLLEWGQARVKELLRIWRDRRGAERIEQLERRSPSFLRALTSFKATKRAP